MIRVSWVGLGNAPILGKFGVYRHARVMVMSEVGNTAHPHPISAPPLIELPLIRLSTPL